MIQYLPERYRPRSSRYTPFVAGVGGHLPRWFYDGIKAIDPKLYFVWHPYEVMYESNIMTEYTGPTEECWFNIHVEFEEELWGYPKKANNSDAPIPDRSWHLWRLCEPGWAHVVKIEAPYEEYLEILARRLYLQAIISDRYGANEYEKMNEREREEANERRQAQAEDLYSEVQRENSWLMNKAAENFERGITRPTNPTREIITSYSGQSNKSKIVRPLTDEEGGLVLPENWDD